MRPKIQFRRISLRLGLLNGLLREGACGTPANMACSATDSSLSDRP